MRADSEYVRSLIPLVEFLGQALGSASEVVLHDVADLDRSVVAIANGHVSNRTIGSPATDLILRIMAEGMHEGRDYISGVRGVAADERAIVASTYFIRREGRLVGMLCINTDETVLRSLSVLIDTAQQVYLGRPTSVEDEPAEHLSSSVAEMAAEAIAAVVGSQNVPVEYLRPEQRMGVVRRLNDRGFFQLKSAVSHTATALGISEPTVYRYLQTLRREEQGPAARQTYPSDPGASGGMASQI